MKTRASKPAASEWCSPCILKFGDASPLWNSVTCRRAGNPGHVRALQNLALGFLLLVSHFGLQASAQNYSIDWYKISGGGGLSTGGVYSVGGRSGQHDTSGAMTGGNLSLTGGFWSLFAVQTPGAPLLSIALTAANTVVVWWLAPDSGWKLHATANLLNGSTWTQIPPPYSTSLYYVEPAQVSNKFYRPHKP